MLLTWALTPILNMVSALFSSLPTADLSWLGSASGVADAIEGYANDAAIFLPVGDMVTVLYWVVVGVIPAVFVYELVQWGYRELPEIFGWGS